MALPDNFNSLTACAKALDALPQACGLSLPTSITQRIGIMSPRARLDLLTGNCGVSGPTLLTRIGSMAAHGRTPPTRFCATCCKRVPRRRQPWRPELVPHTGNLHEEPGVRARPPVKTTPASIASGPADRPAAAIRMGIGKRFSGPSMNPRRARRVPMTARADPVD